MTKKIGFFAGTFDPIHDGHLISAKNTIKEIGLEELYFMVESSPWTDKNPTPLEHRIKMVDIAISDSSDIHQLKFEEERFTIATTLQKIEEMFEGSEICFVFGADTFMKINHKKWPELKKLLKHHIVVIQRNDFTEKELENHAKELGVVIAIIPSVHVNHRSSDVRMNPNKCDIWVPEKVAKYIKSNALYGL